MAASDGPTSDTWIGTLFEVAPGSTEAFCSYQWTRNGAPELVDEMALANLEARLPTSGGVELSCPIVVPLADPPAPAAPSPAYLGAFSESFTRHVRTTPAPENALTGVRVAVVDTAAVAYSSDACREPRCSDNDPHGRAVGRVIARILCSDQDRCSPIKNHLGLPLSAPRVASGRDTARGGSVGTTEDLALALRAALDEWEAIPEPRRPKLVINLSVGWHPIHARLASSELRSATLADVLQRPERAFVGASMVRAVIERARCAGALVLAAAGNAIGEDRALPLFPAAWEEVPSLDPKSCAERRYPARIAPPDAGDPLVYAVSAVDHGGAPLAITRLSPGPSRPGGMAARAALGIAVVSPDPRGSGGYTPMYSGTSMATAVVSGVAASTWRTNPRLSVRRLMATLPRGTCGRDPEYAVNLCLRSGEACEVTSYEIVGQRPVRDAECTSARATLTAPAWGGPARHACATRPGPDACPTRRATAYFLFEPWIHPQPRPTPCGACSIHLLPAHVLVSLQVPLPGVLPSLARVYTRGSPLDWWASYSLEGVSSSGVAVFDRPDRPLPAEASITLNVPAEDGTDRRFETEELVPIIESP